MRSTELHPKQIGVVVIGRNEGARLSRCLTSARAASANVVYVDSGSTDDSVALALAQGVGVVSLTDGMPFTAGRARNAGLRQLMATYPTIQFVQFVDGDCELKSSWISKAGDFLTKNAAVAAVCGRRREIFRNESIYNLLADMEWDTPIGESTAVGGDAMMRVQALQQVSGYREELIAGEEPELCIRLRKEGWRIWRLPEEMTLHDARMTSFRQWWTRTKRAGHAFAEGALLHGFSREHHWLRETFRPWFWVVFLPVATVAVTWLHGYLGLAILGLYPMQLIRLAARGRGTARENWINASFLMIGKLPEMLGQLEFLRRRWLKERAALIEYR